MWNLWQIILSCTSFEDTLSHNSSRSKRLQMWKLQQIIFSSIKFVHGNKDYNCEHCDKSFSQTSDLKRHIHTIHEGHKDYKCESCGKSFSQAGELKRHIHTVHDGHKDDKCDSCCKSFTKLQSLEKHLHIVHDPPCSWWIFDIKITTVNLVVNQFLMREIWRDIFSERMGDIFSIRRFEEEYLQPPTFKLWWLEA